MITLPIGVTQQAAGAGGVAYDPGMMTFDGSTGYYSLAPFTSSGNLVTGVVRCNRASFTGGGVETLMRVNGPSHQRLTINIYASDHATTAWRNKAVALSLNSSGAVICLLISDVDICDSADHTIFYAFDSGNGTAIYYVDGITADDAGASGRVAPTTGSLDTGGTNNAAMYVGASDATRYFGGDLSYVGHGEVYLTNPTDFYHPTNGLQELDESGWTEWGSQPAFWNEFGTMTANAGSAGNMTSNGTITGPA